MQTSCQSHRTAVVGAEPHERATPGAIARGSCARPSGCFKRARRGSPCHDAIATEAAWARAPSSAAWRRASARLALPAEHETAFQESFIRGKPRWARRAPVEAARRLAAPPSPHRRPRRFRARRRDRRDRQRFRSRSPRVRATSTRIVRAGAGARRQLQPPTRCSPSSAPSYHAQRPDAVSGSTSSRPAWRQSARRVLC